jgi:hypothetical protein
MSAPKSPPLSRSTGPLGIRRDGWTIRRQFAFLDTLARTRSVTRAAKAAGMSRESAYRLRRRPSSALFAAAWDRALKGHSSARFASRQSGRKNGGFPKLSLEGHKMDDPLFSLVAP